MSGARMASRLNAAALVALAVISAALVCMYAWSTRELETMRQEVTRQQAELATLRDEGDRLRKAWALEAELRVQQEERRRDVDAALSAVDHVWAGGVLPADVLRVLRAAGVHIPDDAAGAVTDGNASPDSNSNSGGRHD